MDKVRRRKRLKRIRRITLTLLLYNSKAPRLILITS